MLAEVTALRYVTPLREGGSLPGLMEGDDDGTYVVKFTGAGQGPRTLVAEVICAHLLRALGLPVPDVVTVDIDPALSVGEPDEELHRHQEDVTAAGEDEVGQQHERQDDQAVEDERAGKDDAELPGLAAVDVLPQAGARGRIAELVAAHPGKCPLFLCFMRAAGGAIFIEAHDKFFVTPSHQLQQDADARFGEDTYYAKVDTSLPEKAKRSWERKPSNGGGDE